MRHTYGSLTDTMGIIRTQKKGTYSSTLEKDHIYKISKNNLHMNYRNTDTHNPTFRTLQEMNTGYQHTHTPYLLNKNGTNYIKHS
jgi:hypothetical protein